MQFLVVNQEATANIYGHTYRLQAINSPSAGVKDILVADDGSASELLKKHGNILATVSFEKEKVDSFPLPLEKSERIPTGSKVLILRSGGIGDHIMLTPALRAFRELRLREGDIELWLATQEDMFPIFRDNPSIDRLVPLPLTMDKLLEANYVIDFSDSLQNPDFNRCHPTDYYMKFLGVNSEGMIDKTPLISQNTTNLSGISKVLRGLKTYYNGKPLVLMQWEASAHIRRLPPQKLSAISNKFQELTFIVGHHYVNNEKTAQVIEKENMRAINLSHEMKDLNDFLTVMHFVDMVISTDSSAYHIAGAFNIPSLALFGPIGSNLRNCYYPNSSSLDANYDGKTCKSPCGLHKGTCPEAEQLGTAYSPCLMSISESSIQERFQKMVDTHLI